MFDGLQDRLQGVFRHLKGEGRVSEDVLRGALREIRVYRASTARQIAETARRNTELGVGMIFEDPEGFHGVVTDFIRRH